MTETPFHFGKNYANQVLEWMPTDTQESFQRLMQDPQHRAYFASMGWDQPDAITYKINSHGFRCDEFETGPYLVALGCSYTVGIGLPVESTWPYLVSQALGLKCANLAWGGYSTDTCYRLARYWIPRLKPVMVAMLTPPRARLELLMNRDLISDPRKQMDFEVFLPECLSQHFDPHDVYLTHWFANEQNQDINQEKNILALRQQCSDQEIFCGVVNSDRHMCLSRDIVGYARDHMHAGPIAHQWIAQDLINAYTAQSQ
jgi:hypothetical protein